MMRKCKLYLCFVLLMITCVQAVAQDSLGRSHNHNFFDPEKNKMIPDKVYEIGLPLLFLFFLLNAVVSIYRIKSEERIKREAINKGFSEQTLTEMFKEDRLLNKYVYVKWFLILFSVGLSLLVLHFLAYATAIRSGYLSLSVITIFLSGAFFIYYRIIKDK